MSTLITCYDLERSPPQFDAVAFALYVNGYRSWNPQFTSVKVLVSPGPEDGFRACSTWPFGADARQKILRNVGLPILRMIPAEVEVLGEPLKENVFGYGQRGHGMDKLMEGLKAGGRSLRPLMTLPKDDRLITITLREAHHWPERNSNLEEWLKAGAKLRGLGYNVTFIRDTEKMGHELAGFVTDPRASIDLDYRCALYRSAFQNFGVSNGPTWLAFWADAPMLVFRPTSEVYDGWAYSRAFFIHHGIKDQFPDCPPYQRIFWEDDTADAIVNGFLKWRVECQAAK